ncbi:hypothetical protein LINGRAHAP2_LOCUS20251 [Linum grandiflorum]
MDWSYKLLLFSVVILLSTAIDGARADATVSGSVFCDQCKDGRLSLFDYPMTGVGVRMACVDDKGETLMSREERTNMFGWYNIRFDGTPDLRNCYTQFAAESSSTGEGGGASSGGNSCIAAAGPPQKLRLMFSMFGMEMYSVDSLLSQPAKPMSFCPNSPSSSSSSSSPPPPSLPSPPPPPPPPPPAFTIPPMPPMPFLEASACPHQTWTATEYRCYWRIVTPETKVAVAFGLPAAQRYGTEMTLLEALQGRGDPYRTLLREATTSLLNSYNSLRFRYDAVAVVARTNYALLGSQRDALYTALHFIRANSGSPSAAAGSPAVTCRLSPCK